MPNEYYIQRNDKVRGPFSEEKLRELQAEGKLRGTDLVSTRSNGGWKPLDAILEKSGGRSKAAARSSVSSRLRMPLSIGIFILAAAILAGGTWYFRRTNGETAPKDSPPGPSTATAINEPTEVSTPESLPAPAITPNEFDQPFAEGMKVKFTDGTTLTLSGGDSRIESRVISAMFKTLSEDLKFSVNFRWTASQQSAEIPVDQVTIIIQPPKIPLYEGVHGCAFRIPAQSAERALDIVSVAFIRCAHGNSFESGRFSHAAGFDPNLVATNLGDLARTGNPEKRTQQETGFKKLREHTLGVRDKTYDHASLKLDDGHVLFSIAQPLLLCAGQPGIGLDEDVPNGSY